MPRLSDERIQNIRKFAELAMNDATRFGAEQRTAISQALTDIDDFEKRSLARSKITTFGRVFPHGTWQSHFDGMQDRARRLFGAIVGIEGRESTQTNERASSRGVPVSPEKKLTPLQQLNADVRTAFRRPN